MLTASLVQGSLREPVKKSVRIKKVSLIRRIKLFCLLVLFIKAAVMLCCYPVLAYDEGALNREILLTQLSGGEPQTGLPVVRLQSGAVELEVEVALTYRQKSTGLMFREELADDRGMIFVYSTNRILSFWMKNTYIPLSIAYLCADGVIQEIYDMNPLSLDTVHSSLPVRYALETPQGWFKQAGLEPGDRFEFPPGFPNF